MSKHSLRLAYLYPKLLNIYGDRGNVLTLKKRCEWRDIEFIVDEIDIGDNISENLYDMYFIGGGQDKEQSDAAKALMSQKEHLKNAQINNAVMLAICGGYQLFGKYYELPKGKLLEGIDLLDIHTIASKERHIGNVTTDCNIPEIGTLVGFENHSGLTYIEMNSQTTPLGKVINGSGNNGKDLTEGAYKKNVFGTYLHGSFLPKNPRFADFLIKTALVRKYFENIDLLPLEDKFANLAHENVMNKNY